MTRPERSLIERGYAWMEDAELLDLDLDPLDIAFHEFQRDGLADFKAFLFQFVAAVGFAVVLHRVGIADFVNGGPDG